jgi:putative membrane protein
VADAGVVIRNVRIASGALQISETGFARRQRSCSRRNLLWCSKITLPANVSKSDAETYAKLSKLSAAEFDRAYANEMVKDHEQDVAESQKEAMGGKDPSLKQFAAKTLPTLESHLQQAREMQRTVQACSGK